jgi:hypothetical protein
VVAEAPTRDAARVTATIIPLDAGDGTLRLNTARNRRKIVANPQPCCSMIFEPGKVVAQLTVLRRR